MIYRVVLDDLYDLHTSDINCMLLNPSIELEMNAAGSFNFTLPPTHPYWDSIEILKSTIDVYEDDDLIFTGRVANIDKNWNNERVVECEGALAYFNDSIHRQMKWDTPLPIASEDPTVHNFLKDILDNHNVFVGDATNRQIHIGHIYVDPYLVTREVNYDTTLDILTRMCIDTNGGYFMIRKDPETHLLYLDWLKDFTEESGQPASFGVNLLDFNTGLHAADICTGVLARGATVNDQVVTLSNVELVDETTYPNMSVDHYTTHDQDILWHRDGMAKFGRVVQVHEFPDAQTDWKNDGQIVDNSLFEEAKKWLEEKNTKVESIEVEVAELSWLQEGVPKYKLGQIVEILDDAHMAGESYEVRRLPMYKLSCDLSSGSKKVTLGRPPKKELTQISASNSDSSTLSSGNSSGSSSGGGSGSGEECKVHDVRVDGTSVVSNKIANISLTGKADTSVVNALAATVATKADASSVIALADVVSGKQDQIEFNTQEAATEVLTRLKADDKVYNLGGGTEVVANPSETATDDLNTIKIGDTVYDIPGGGSSTNYGKFKCDVLFNTPTTTSAWASPIEICSEEKAKEYDMIYLITKFVDGTSNGFISNSYLVNSIGQTSDSEWLMGIRSNSAWNDTQGFIFLSFDNSKLKFYTNTGNSSTLYKVYGLKFENKLINRSDIYSEEERMIGRWTDGKPLYQKTYDLGSATAFPNNTWTTIISNVTIPFDKVIKCDGIQADPAAVSFDIWFDESSNALKVRSLRDGNESIRYFTIQYTKTTDSADSGVIPEDPMIISDSTIYSEEEQVVGSWTDGKPLYQKTIIINNPSSGKNTFQHGLQNADHILCKEWHFTRIDGSVLTNAVGEWASAVLSVSASGGQYKVDSGWDVNKLYITLQYTKTTDSILSGPKKGKIVQRSDIYSEEERLIGRWTDGKPLYQRTIVKDLTLSASWQNYYDLTGIDLVNVEINKLIRDGEPIPLAFSNIGVGSWIKRDGYLKFCTQGSQASEGWILKSATIQYTKTADLPFSKQLIEDPMFISDPMIYSEEEQVVGSWTDGKPLYQKTVKNIGVTVQQNSWTNTGIPFAGIDHWEVIFNKSTSNLDNQYPMLYRFYDGNFQVFCQYTIPLDELTIQYTKTTDTPLSGPKKGKIVQRSDIYSEEERMIGRWTDGKPIYQKTWFNVPNGTDLVTNVDTLVDYRVKKRGASGSEDYQDIGDGFRIEESSVVKVTNNIAKFTSWTSTQGYLNKTAEVITLQYTKTTDEPFSKQLIEDPQFVMMSDIYSEGEQVVGRWTDGKPIYQKTWTLSSTININTSGVTLPSQIGNDLSVAENIVNANAVRLKTDNASAACIPLCVWGSGTSYSALCSDSWSLVREITIQYTKTTDAPGTGPTKGNLIYLPALYSEEEREVGVWTDGKPIYQKTFKPTSALTNGSWNSNILGTSGSGISIKNVDGLFYGSSYPELKFPLSYYRCASEFSALSTNDTGDDINLLPKVDGVGTLYVKDITVQYTKTTDQPGSGTWTPESQLAHHYSTSEKVVGTWIDGSTIYERTWDLGSDMIGSANSWVDMRSYISTIPNCNFILDAKSMTSDGVSFHLDGAYNAGYLELRKSGQNWSGQYITLQYTKSS